MESKELKISANNALTAYKNADENGKKLLENLFGKDIFAPKNVMERIKTFEDAYLALGENHPLVKSYEALCSVDTDHNLETYAKLRIIVAALNEGWEPQFTEEEWRWYPWHTLWTESELAEKSDEWKADRHLIMIGDRYQSGYAGLAFAHSNAAPSDSSAHFGSLLCLKSEALATYCGKQFIDLWADFMLINK